jgi:hypothetical protein|uniref:Uncharacterized protein n=1 Tax=Siphoviridae sp. ctSXZ3 TaxID=2825510 RepID=A0A8S5VEK9_9CAUD|nr:MAG TPA: hypothetical protein [Siphoviridae sp. ctSXZ3]
MSLKDSHGFRQIKKVLGFSSSVGGSLVAHCALSLVPLPAQLPLRALFFLGGVGLGAYAADKARQGMETQCDVVADAVDTIKETH